MSPIASLESPLWRHAYRVKAFFGFMLWAVLPVAWAQTDPAATLAPSAPSTISAPASITSAPPANAETPPPTLIAAPPSVPTLGVPSDAPASITAPPTPAPPPSPSPVAFPVTAAPSESHPLSPVSVPTPPAVNEISQGSELPTPPLPPSFADFAADFKPTELHPRWVIVQVGSVETSAAPPDNQSRYFALPSLPESIRTLYNPIEFSALLSTKSRYEKVTIIDHDVRGNPLKFSLPIGTIVYFLPREETPNGILFSFYYYDATAVQWSENPVGSGKYLPQTTVSIVDPVDFTVPSGSYVFILTSHRSGPSQTGSTARPVPLYTYLILGLREVEPPVPPSGIVH